MGSAVDCFQELTLVPANAVALDTVVEQYIDDTCMPAWFQNAVNTAEYNAFVTDSIRAMAQAAHVVPWDWRRWGIPSVVIPLS
eukprot:gene15908-20063_t